MGNAIMKDEKFEGGFALCPNNTQWPFSSDISFSAEWWNDVANKEKLSSVSPKFIFWAGST